MIKDKQGYILCVLLSLIVCGCKNYKQPVDNFHFTLMNGDKTNILFNNKITESDSVKVYD